LFEKDKSWNVAQLWECCNQAGLDKISTFLGKHVIASRISTLLIEKYQIALLNIKHHNLSCQQIKLHYFSKKWGIESG
jgi:hypothetical protein